VNATPQFVEFGTTEVAVRAVLMLVGLGALVLAYVGSLIAGIPRKGQNFSAAFLQALPIATVIVSLLAAVAVLPDSFDDVGFSKLVI
jgi:hypothetical protein